MKIKGILKILTDVLMTILLLLLMAFNMVGPRLHELFGAGMFVTFIMHNILNYKWYKNILKGRYSAYRLLHTTINISLFAAMICSMITGIIMSRYVFKFLSIEGYMKLARTVHMSASYLSFILVSIHLGMHWNMIISMFKNISLNTKINGVTTALKFMGILTACYGAYVFKKNEILSNILLINKFAFLVSYKSPFFFFIDYLAMMGFFVCVSHYAVKLFIQKNGRN
ncbi:DUF4405 domain-containing protein [Clostridium butyricum]|uniref:DUF4405 domain-containing protein n=1 Tax=Clostridium butyricum TaxID=1492 RepID=UPI0006E6F5C3|nr:DUF4405 domain-containing protein [Clostridium butyricum]KQB79566.1 hypothetical protein AK964_00750 [Clostridium butyricum]MDU0324999.1 DUF4405 domain-containing protein [Clostridium butyricum]